MFWFIRCCDLSFFFFFLSCHTSLTYDWTPYLNSNRRGNFFLSRVQFSLFYTAVTILYAFPNAIYIKKRSVFEHKYSPFGKSIAILFNLFPHCCKLFLTILSEFPNYGAHSFETRCFPSQSRCQAWKERCLFLFYCNHHTLNTTFGLTRLKLCSDGKYIPFVDFLLCKLGDYNPTQFSNPMWSCKTATHIEDSQTQLKNQSKILWSYKPIKTLFDHRPVWMFHWQFRPWRVVRFCLIKIEHRWIIHDEMVTLYTSFCLMLLHIDRDLLIIFDCKLTRFNSGFDLQLMILLFRNVERPSTVFLLKGIIQFKNTADARSIWVFRFKLFVWSNGAMHPI